MQKLIALPHTIHSRHEFDNYLTGRGYTVALSSHIPAEKLLHASMPDWTKKHQGCIVMHQPLRILNEPDPSSSIGLRVVIATDPPFLVQRLPGMACSFCFEIQPMLKGQQIFIEDGYSETAN